LQVKLKNSGWKGEEITSKKRELLEAKMRFLERALEELPKGKLMCAGNGSKGKYAKWYVGTEKGRVYLPKKERKLAEQLALRRLHTAQWEQLRQESKLLKEYELFQEENVYSNEIKNLISQESPFYELLKNRIAGSWSTEAYIKQWQEEEYQANCAHPETLEVYYWEHFGMMSQASYREKTAHKLRLYGEHQVYPFHQLITTYESDSVSLDSELIQKMISMFFRG